MLGMSAIAQDSVLQRCSTHSITADQLEHRYAASSIKGEHHTPNRNLSVSSVLRWRKDDTRS